MASLLHETIRDLHTLEESTASEAETHGLLARIVQNLFRLFNLDEKSQRVVLIRTAVFPEQKVVFHTQKRADVQFPSKHPQNPSSTNRSLRFSSEATYSDICQYIDEKLDNLTLDSVHRELVSILESRADKQPIRLKESYASLVTRFSQLILQVLQLQFDAELSLLQYLSKCYNHELNYYLSVNKRLDVLPSSDTEKIMHALDKILEVPDTTQLLESMFSYSSEGAEAVNFKSSDDYFDKLYSNFLQLTLTKAPEQFAHQSLANLKAMVRLYKKSISADAVELGGSSILDLKLEYVINFVSSPSEKLSSGMYRDFILNTIENCKRGHSRDEMKTESNSPSDSLSHPDLPHQIESDPPDFTDTFLSWEANDLISGVSAVFENLRDLNIDVNPLFPRCFCKYLVLVLDEMADFAVPDDHSYIRSTAATVNSVISYTVKDGDLEESGILSILQDLQTIQDFLISPQHLQTLLMRETYLEYLKTKASLAHSFRKWNIKVLSIKQMELNCAERAKITSQRQLKQNMSKWYNRVCRYRKLHEHATTYSSKKLLTRYFNSQFIKPYLRVAANETRGDIYVLSRYFRAWTHHWGVLEEKRNLAVNEIQKRVSLAIFQKLRSVYKKRQENQALALKFRSQNVELQDSALRDNVFLLWRAHLQQTYTEDIDVSGLFQEYDARMRSFVLKKPFALWVSRQKLNRSVETFEHVQRDLLLRTVLTRWMSASKLVKHESLYTALQHLFVKKTFFVRWKTHCQNLARAEQLSRHRQLAHGFNQLRRAAAERKFQSTQNFLVAKMCWTKWKLQCYVQENQAYSAKQSFDVWRRKYRDLTTRYSSAEKLYETKTKRSCFDTWNRFYILLDDLQIVADLNFQRNFLNRMSKKVYLYKEHERVADSHRLESQDRFERKLLVSLIQIWKSKHHALFENMAQNRISHFQKTVISGNLLKASFKTWRRKKAALQNKRLELEYQLYRFQRGSLLMRLTFDQWINATNTRYDKEAQADAFYFGKVSGKVWRTWIQRTVRIVDFLNVQADTIQDRKDYDLVVRLLRQWYYKHAAVLSAKDSACRAFVEKRKRLSVKTMFDLWMYKHSRKNSEYAEAYAEANSTFMSNSSPLARKNVNSRNVSQSSINKGRPNDSFFENESYFYTPNEIASPFTPVKNRTSPTRLQETNQRVRLDRLDALTRRFRNANLRDDPRSGTLTSGAFPRLSPPKIGARSGILGARPPPPVFDEPATNGATASITDLGTGNTSGLKPEATDGPLDASSPTRAPLDDDEPLLATAKSLQRIKPIVINYEDAPSELHYSTVNTLKDRLKSAQVSPRRPQ